MKLRKMLLCGVAATALSLAAALPNSSLLPNLATPAQAAVQASVSIGFGTFYDRLAPHGDWVLMEGRHVWVPGQVDADWRPYTVGRWAYTRPYGWTWVSDEPYGWAVYHYGRWGYHRTVGWYWVPDTVWAPAWVTWRASGDYAAWAPMPPQGLVGVSYEVDAYAIPARYWVAVPTASFLAPNIFSVALHFGEPRFYDAVRYTRPIGQVTIVQNIAVNTVINVNYIERQTGETVRVREVRQVSDVEQARLEDDAIAVFAPAIEEEPDARPKQEKTQQEVAEERGVDLAAEPAEKPEDQPVEVAKDAPPAPQDAVAEEAAPVTDEELAKKPKDEPAEAAETPPEEAPAAEVVEEAPAKKEAPAAEVVEEAPAKKKAPAAEVTEEAPAKKEAPAAAAEPEKPGTGVEERAIGEPAAPGKKRKKDDKEEEPAQ